MKIKLLREKFETRKAYFLKAFDRNIEDMAIVSFSGCNFKCPYCKRGCQYIDCYGKPIKTVSVNEKDFFDMIDNSLKQNKTIRLSGGDPCSFPKLSLKIAKYVYDKHKSKISLAHNGSDLDFINSLIKYLDYVAIDFKSFDVEKLKKLTGIKKPKSQQKEIIELCNKNNILVDIRTPIFGDTTKEELIKIAEIISKYPNVFWTFRKYNKVVGCDFADCDIEYVTKLAKEIKTIFPNIKIGTRNYWKGGFEIL